MSSHDPAVDYLTVEDLLDIATGVLPRFDVRDPGLLASAAARPATAVFGTEAYPTLVAKAAALMHSLARNHPLIDGNKRLAWSATRIFLLVNRHDLQMDVDTAEALVVGVAEGKLDVEAISAILDPDVAPTA